MTSKIVTFQRMHISVDEYVYEPAEDTYLLLDELSQHSLGHVLELGTGCGIIALECARRGSLVVCSDISSAACVCAQKNINRNLSHLKNSVEVRRGNLFSICKQDERFDSIIMNPPYLPSRPHIQVDEWLSTAVESGTSGLIVIKQFISECSQYLCTNGLAFLIVSSLTDLSALQTHILNNQLSYTIARKLSFEDEEIFVYKLSSQMTRGT